MCTGFIFSKKRGGGNNDKTSFIHDLNKNCSEIQRILGLKEEKGANAEAFPFHMFLTMVSFSTPCSLR
jgi:hypothetical protein